ncbi:TetR/AcrR family transcriptional regulator [Ureibacillus sp. Re31]|uniref:TetR/AcrR family transcriptional regulator n=1 Tax=Ureibacillus galli TaxID=2762222 RepID=A0ABR8X9K3_9BACL|nr:TetR/AcrR family transcriptional regulator [Ureibacillus galli]MBD8025989.1 TetR/AcrR family transcriptional regulator [Ureibacillus galli]
MEKKKYERKTMQTKKEIKDAFISLIEEKGFNAVTVRDIATRAKINRGTFYLHYLDKFDLLEKCEQEIFQKIEGIARELNSSNMKELFSSGRPLPFIVNLFHYFQKDASFLKVILSPKGDPLFEEKLRNTIIDNMFRNISNIPNMSNLNIPLEVMTQFISSAHLGVIRYWLNTDMKQTPEEISSMLVQMILKGPLEASGLIKIIMEQK